MNLDIHTGVITFVILLLVLAVIGFWSGIRLIRKARTLKFFRMRRDRMVTGWRMLGFSVICIILALLARQFAEPVAYHFFPPTITPTLTPTPSPTPPQYNLSGKICFPGESIPAMTVFSQNTTSESVQELQIQAGQSQY